MPSSAELYDQGLEAFRKGDQKQSLVYNQQSLESAASDYDRARAYIGLSRIAFRNQDHAELERLMDLCRPIYEALADKTGVTSPNHMLAESLRMHGRFDEARELYLANIREAKELGQASREKLENINLALLEIAAGNPMTAVALLKPELVEPEKPYSQAYYGLALGASKVWLGAHAEGLGHLRESQRILSDQGEIWDPADQAVYDAAMRLVEKGEERPNGIQPTLAQ